MAKISKVHTKAHGKILWLGGYSILEKGNIGYVTTVDAGVHVHLSLNDEDIIRIEVPQFDVRAEGKVDLKTGKFGFEPKKEMLLVKIAAEAALMYAVSEGCRISGFNIRSENDPAFSYRIGDGGRKVSKSGLGSSAAVTAATVGAVLTAFGLDFYKDDTLHKIAQVAHALGTGKIGSGFDIAAASYGDIIYSRYSPELIKDFPKDFSMNDVSRIVKMRWDYSIERFPLPNVFDFLVANFVGNAAITTSMVGSVNGFKETNRQEYDKIIREMDDRNRTAIEKLRLLQKIGEEESFNEFKSAFDQARVASKRLGKLSNVPIEPDDATELIEESNANGGFATKLPGAGGYDSIASLIRVENGNKGMDKLRKFWSEKENLSTLKVVSNRKGVEVLKD